MTEKALKRILLVDDEPNILNAVQRELQSPPHSRYRYEIEAFSVPEQALARAREQAFDLVISDYRMPGMDGLALLKALGTLQPDCARIALSGQTDFAALTRMVNETHVYRFIPKPWHDYYLKGSVVQALNYAGTLAEHRRLAGQVREHGIEPPAADDDAIEQILVVDDDPGVLASLSRVLTHHTRMDDLYSVIRAEVAHQRGALLREGRLSVQVTPSPRHALEMAGKIDFACVLADYRMPEMNGIDLLQRFADLRPECERILISGQVGADELVNAIDSAHVFAYIAKPWEDYELKSCIALALAHRRMLHDNRVLAAMVEKSGHFAAGDGA